MIEEKKLKAYLDEIEAVNKKHKLRLEPVLQSNNYAIQAQFHVQEISDKPKADGQTDKGVKDTKK